MNMDRWGVHWSHRRVVLRFARDKKGVAVALHQAAVRQLATRLDNAVLAYENTHGTLWCEQHRLHGQRSDFFLDGPDLLSGDSAGRHFYQLVRNLPLSGYERSFKLRADQLISGRFLVGLPVAVMAAADIDYLASRLEAPAPYRAALGAALAQAQYLHVGFEPDGGQTICKMYLEFAEGNSDRQPLYVGYKWDPADAQQRAISHYVSAPLPDTLALADDVARTGLEDIIALATRRVPRSALRYVDVTDLDTQRVSFDINLYPAGLRVRDVQPMLLGMQRYFSIPEKEMAALIARTADAVVGHVAGGTDRHGRAFVTIYHAHPASLMAA
ncbi:hypothetical protein IMCC9480_2058 [Oxalobacteraceae bacterium IMCC9480]|nr:hypothetical protein IMCC9480_2058 [Oxalobacteraceae bacterium IMCC9480]NDP59643.1 hypothetical protein [Oxalobacteraceae bacterium]